jgi:CheY-like chemotaxis protein
VPQYLGSTILVVDDDPEVREFAVTALRDAGYVVVEAPNAEAALRRLEAERGVDLLITDFAMPLMTGVELIRRVRRTNQDMPAVLITGIANKTHADLAVENTAILRKPFGIPELIAQINHALKRVKAVRPPLKQAANL